MSVNNHNSDVLFARVANGQFNLGTGGRTPCESFYDTLTMLQKPPER
jgi:hypothetical protein